jgi:hypothetical protein
VSARAGRHLAAGLVAALLVAPAAASAQGGVTSNPFSPGLPQSVPSIPTSTAPAPIAIPTTTTSGGGTLSGGSALAIGLGALIVLGGIAFFIWHDARRRAPIRHRMAEEGAGAGGSKARPKPRKLSPAERRRRKRGRAR